MKSHPRVLPSEKCCGNCSHWHAPTDGIYGMLYDCNAPVNLAGIPITLPASVVRKQQAAYDGIGCAMFADRAAKPSEIWDGGWITKFLETLGMARS